VNQLLFSVLWALRLGELVVKAWQAIFAAGMHFDCGGIARSEIKM
jgi:hypothetical protein